MIDLKQFTDPASWDMARCAEAIQVAGPLLPIAMPRIDYIVKSLREDGVPLNEMVQLEATADLLDQAAAVVRMAVTRVNQLLDEARAKALEEARQRRRG